mgnify:CR=1 FL=1
MSNWSHVAAIARVDHLAFLGTPELDFEEIFGKEIHYESDEELWEEATEYPERFLPMGSEGSLRMSVWINTNPRALARYTVSIFGDLRSHDDPDGIIEWFKDKLEGLSIRQAFITVHNERFGYASWTYEDDDIG